MAAIDRHRIIRAGFAGLTAMKGDRWLRPIAQGRGLILMFHHVRPPRAAPFQPNALLEITPAFLDLTIELVRREGFEIVPLDRVPERLASPDGRRFVALTFDDGYRDNVEFAQPVLRRHGAPWTEFVTTDYANGGGRLWWIELEEAVRRLDRLTIRGEGGRERDLPAGTTQEKRAAFAEIYNTLRKGPEEDLRAAIAVWVREAGLDSAALVRELCLDWAELARLARDGDVTIGAHTLTHPMLGKLDDATARREIVDAKGIIEGRLGTTVRHIAYPVGDPASAGQREFAEATAAGYMTGVTTRPGHLFAGHVDHLTALPRVSVNGLYQTEAAMRSLLSGAPFLLWNRGRRVNVA